jgi:hypothetical protein
MLIHNNVTENVVTIVIARVFKDIRTLVRKQPSVALPPSSLIVQSLNKEGTQDFFSSPLFSMANNIHVPSKPTSQVQDPPDLKKRLFNFKKTTMYLINNSLS